MIPLQLDLVPKPGDFFEGPRVGEGDGGVVGKSSEPLELALPDAGAAEHGQDAQNLALEDEGLAGEGHDSFRPGPLDPGRRQ